MSRLRTVRLDIFRYDDGCVWATARCCSRGKDVRLEQKFPSNSAAENVARLMVQAVEMRFLGELDEEGMFELVEHWEQLSLDEVGPFPPAT